MEHTTGGTAMEQTTGIDEEVPVLVVGGGGAR